MEGLALVRPPALRRGDTVGIIAPASNLQRNALLAGCETLRRMGYNPIFDESIMEQNLYFAGSAERRLEELHGMFLRDDVRAIICARGGYGANYLVDKIDVGLIRSHPKIFVGYSDVTSLLTLLLDEAGLVVFHGPMAAKDFAVPDGNDGIDVASWQAALTGTHAWSADTTGVRGLVSGSAEGMFYGGCLPMLAATLGTPHEIRTENTILFLEDIGSKPYQIDRMLMQLKQGGKLASVRGIIFGQMNDCVQNAQQAYTLEDVVLRIVGNLGIPVAFGLRSGHVGRANITLPLGVRASLTVNDSEVELRFLEPSSSA